MTTTSVDHKTQADADSRRRSARNVRYSARHALWKFTDRATLRSCGRGVRKGEQVEIHRTTEGRATTSGLVSCSSVWACPVCSAHIRQERANEIEQGYLTWTAQEGCEALFLTLTLRHWKGAPLRMLVDAMYDAWRRTIRGNPWKRVCARYGIAGSVKAAEVTYGDKAGWHPHLHLLLFTSELSDDQLEALTAWLHARWSKFLMAHHRGLKPKEGIGVKVQRTYNDGIGRYLAKVQDGYGKDRGLGIEIARGDLKRGRRAGQRVPFEILEDIERWGDKADLELWREYEAATAGRRAIEWSRGMRDLLGLNEERSDDEITADADELSDETRLGVIPADVWYRVCAARRDAQLLDAAEVAGWDGVLRILRRVDPPPGSGV